MYKKLGKTAQILSRTVYEFDANPKSTQEIPVIVAKSTKEAQVRDDYVNYALSKVLFTQLQMLFENGCLKSKPKQKHKKREEAASAASSAITTAPAPAPAPASKTPYDSIYDDDQLQGSEYDPLAERHPSSVDEDGLATAKGLFAGLQGPAIAPSSSWKIASHKAAQGDRQDVTMKSVRDLLAAQARRDQAQQQVRNTSSVALAVE
jgi:hypothetical protein